MVHRYARRRARAVQPVKELIHHVAVDEGKETFDVYDIDAAQHEPREYMTTGRYHMNVRELAHFLPQHQKELGIERAGYERKRIESYPQAGTREVPIWRLKQ